MKAVIMAGGEGTRLRPLTSNAPKPLLPVANRPMMEHVINLLKRHGLDDIVVTVAYRANAIRTYFGDGSEFGVRIVYASEETPLGTAGSVRNAMAELDDTFLVISGDVVTDMDLGDIIKFHRSRSALVTIGLKSMDNPLEFGIVITREDGSIERFLEKPSWGQVFSDTINTGVYVLEPEIFDHIDANRPTDFSSDVFPALLEANRPLFGFVTDGYWEDVGTIEAYVRAHQDALDERVALDIPGFRLGGGVWLGEGTEIDPAAKVQGPVVIGDNCRIEANAHLREYSVLGDNVRVSEGGFIHRAIVQDNVYLGPGVSLRGCVVGRSSDIRRAVQCQEGVVIGDGCFIGEHAVINAGLKVYPSKTIEPGAVVNSSIIWESRGARSLFGRNGVAGLANVDVTPELAVRVAMAYAATMKKGSTVTTSRDTSRAARVLKRALMVGFNAAGIDVNDLEVATVPLTRFHIRGTTSGGGVTVRLAANDQQSVEIRFFDPSGIDLNEAAQRKVERIFSREDFRRALAGEIGDILFPSRNTEQYSTVLMDHLDTDEIRSARLKVVLDYAFGAVSFVMPQVLSKLGCEVLAVNPYANTRQALGFDQARHAGEVGALVRAAGAHLGAVFDSDGEHLTLVDDSGHVLSDDESMLSLLQLVLATRDRATVALPISTSRVAEQLCRDAGATLIQTKLSTAHVMEVASLAGIDFAASQDGGFIFPRFLPAYDCVAAFVHTLGLLAATGRRLSSVVSAMPRVHIAHERVATPWEKKGSVMRLVVEQTKDHDHELVDGVKVRFDDGWALVLPDPEEPVTHVWAEAGSGPDARARAQDQARRIRQMLR